MIIQKKRNELEQQKQQLLHNLQKEKAQSTYQVDTKSNIPTIPTLASGTDSWKGGIAQIQMS